MDNTMNSWTIVITRREKRVPWQSFGSLKLQCRLSLFCIVRQVKAERATDLKHEQPLTKFIWKYMGFFANNRANRKFQFAFRPSFLGKIHRCSVLKFFSLQRVLNKQEMNWVIKRSNDSPWVRSSHSINIGCHRPPRGAWLKSDLREVEYKNTAVMSIWQMLTSCWEKAKYQDFSAWSQ